MSGEAASDGGLSADARALRAVLESAVAAIVTIDSTGRIQSTNPAVQRLFGYEPNELLGRNVSVLMPRPFADEHDGYINRYLTTGERKIIGIGREVQGRHKDGTVFPIHLSVGEFGVGGKRFFTGIIHDMGAQRRAEARLSDQEALFRSIFEGFPDVLVIADRSRTMQLLNSAVTRVFGYGVEELKGRSSRLLYESQEEWERHGLDLSVLADLNGAPKVVKLRRKSGETFHAEVVRSCVRDGAGQIAGYLAVVRDITEKLEQEAVLRQALRMEAIGQLTGGIAHDFNNLLTVILGNVELLQPMLKDELASALANEALEAAEMGARLTDRLLTFSRRKHLERKTVSLNEIVLGMFELLRRSLGEPVDLSTALKADLWPTDVDPVQLENAILNLAINARDAMPQGGRIVIETRNAILEEQGVTLVPGLAAGDYVQLSVSDNGTGMAEHVKERAFEPFFTTKGPGKGSGLGLAMIYGFAKQSGGHATIYSEVGKGTTVNLYLPRSVADAAATAGPKADGRPLPGHGEVVLVVEDDERVRRLTRSRLEMLGYKVVEAASGPEALQILDTYEPVDLLFSDLVMPGGLSGLDLCRKVREIRPELPMLLTSGYAAELIESDAVLELGLTVLRKPYRQIDLARTFRLVLDSAKRTPAAFSPPARRP